MFKSEILSRILAFIVASAFVLFVVHSIKTPHVVPQTVIEEPSYKHSLKIGNKVIRSYRSPAAIRKAESERLRNSDSSSNFDNSDFSNAGSAETENSKTNEVTESASDHDSRSSYPSYGNRISSPSSQASTNAQGKAGTSPRAGGGGAGGMMFSNIPSGSKNTSGSTAGGSTTSDSSSGGGSSSTSSDPVPTISGKVKPLSGVVTKSDFFKMMESAYAANTCTNPRVMLFDLSSMSVLLDNPISNKVLTGEVSFTFDPKTLSLDLSTPTRYLLITRGCTTNYKRIITSFYKEQDLDLTTTLISSIINSQSAGAVSTASSDTMENLYANLAGASGAMTVYNDIYDLLHNTPELTNLFTNTFSGGLTDELEHSAPDINEVTYTTALNEKTSYNYIVDATHWDSAYVVAQEWQVDTVTVSNSPTWSYEPTANSPATVRITLVTGKKNTLDANVDRSTPYHEVSWDITIADTFPVLAPAVAFNAVLTNPSSTRNLSLDLSTGAVSNSIYADCETFTSFAVTENSATPVAGDFTESCSAGPVQALNHTLVTMADGPVDLKFWSKDARGNVSAASTLNLVIDTTAPVMSFVNLQSGYSSDDDHTFEWKVTEAHASSAQTFDVELYNGTAWVNMGTVAMTDGPLTNEVFNKTLHLPNVNVGNAKVRVTYADTLGQQTVITSANFNINRPVLASSPATIDLGNVLNKNLSAATNFTFTNSGTVPSKVCSTVTVTGANASEFTLSADNCSGNAIVAGGSCAMSVRATPTAKGTRTADVNLVCGNDSYSTTLTIDSLNNAPVTTAKTNSTLEETAVFITLGSITDVDGDSVTYSFPTNPSHGVVDNCYVDTTNYICRYTPGTDYNGTDSFTFKSNDGTVESNTSTATITILPLNDAPTLAGVLALTTNEDTALNFDLVAGADVDLDTLTYVITAAPAHGTLVCPVATTTACTYTPALNYFGADSFTYRVTDGTLNSATLTATMTINAVNDAPVVAANQSLSTRDNFAYNFTIDSGSDVDNAIGTLTYKLVSGPATGSLTNCIDGTSYTTDRTCTYTAPVNFDGTVSFTYLVNDDALDSVATATVTIVVADQTSTTPNLSPVNFVPTAATTSNPLTLTAASCSDISYVMIQESSTAPTTASSGWQSCSTVAAAMLFDPSVTNQQGFRTLRVYGRDPHDNISAPQFINFIYDSMAPQITIENIPTIPNGIAYPIKWRLTEASVLAAAVFKLEYTLDGGANWTTEANVPVGQDGPHSSTLYTYNWNVPAGTYPNSQYRISLTDSNNLTGTASSNAFRILVDLNAPNMFAGQMKINGSMTPPPTPQKYVNVSLKALDGDTNITHFCLKIESTAPALNDACWRAVDAPQPGLTPAESLDLVNFPFLLGFVPGTYNVYAWTRDLGGNISNNTGTIGQDLVTIDYFSDLPPVISNFFVSNTVTPPNPITGAEMIFDTGNPVYIKWTAVDDKGIKPTLSLYYTTDDVTWTEIASALNNDKNNCAQLDEGGTSLDDDSTGCYQWTSPLSSLQYFKVQLIVEDTASQATSIASLPMNSNRFKILAGNMDPGVNSSAKSAIIAAPGAPALHSLAVASDGKVFIRDASFGLMYINPRSGIYEQLLSITGTSSGDNGPVSSATARAVYKIAMDYQDRLIVWDYDRIRRIDTRVTPMTIETIIGAANNGAAGTQSTDIVTDPADLKVYPGPGDYVTFQPLPNGDLYFQAGPFGTVDGGNVLRIYRGSLATPTVNSIRISGTGTADDYAGPLSMTTDTLMGYYMDFNVNTSAVTKIMAKLTRYPVGCSFYSIANIDTTTYASTPPHPPAHVSTCGDWASRTSNDGKTYHFNNTVAWPIQVSRYDAVSNTNIPVLGSGGQGYCVDGTAATSCKTNLTDIFVTAAGKVFFLDNGLVRVIDDTGNVQTLYGQTKTYGDYGLAQDARFNGISYIDHGIGDDVILYDSAEKVIREIRPNETINQVIRIAGNGETGAINFAVPAGSQTLNGASWNQPGTLATDSTNGNVYFPCTWGMICKLDRISGLWEIFSGRGDVSGAKWTDNADLGKNDPILGGYTPTILANYGGRMVTGSYEWSGVTNMNSTLRELDSTTNLTRFLAGKIELDGASGCPDGDGNLCNVNSARSEGHAMTYHSGLNAWLYEQGSVLRTLNTNAGIGQIGTFASVPEAISSMVYNAGSIYYCSDAGLLRKWDAGTGTVTSLPFPSTSIQCTGMNILYKNASGGKPARLVFPFRQNGLAGIGEYFL